MPKRSELVVPKNPRMLSYLMLSDLSSSERAEMLKKTSAPFRSTGFEKSSCNPKLLSSEGSNKPWSTASVPRSVVKGKGPGLVKSSKRIMAAPKVRGVTSRLSSSEDIEER